MKRLREIVIRQKGDKDWLTPSITLEHPTHYLIYDIDAFEDFAIDDPEKVVNEYDNQHNVEDGTRIEIFIYKRNGFTHALIYEKQHGKFIYIGCTLGG